MIFSGIVLSVALMGGLQPGDPWPSVADSALVEALDTLDLVPRQLDFNRHWVRGVHLADSTVLRAIQHVEDIPVILRERLDLLTDYSLLPTGCRGMEGLVELIELLQYSDSMITAEMEDMGQPALDSLISAIPAVWLNEDSPLDWDSVLSDWGLCGIDIEEMPMDTLASLFERWDLDILFPVSEMVIIAKGLQDVRWPDELSVTLPGVQGTTVSFCFDGPVRWVIGGSGDNIYSSDCPFELIIDVGGSDFYGEGLAGAVGPAGRRISVIVDLAGDDTYFSSAPVSQGCGLMGLGGIVDLLGSDIYTAGDFSQGAGIMGQGFLVDLEGDDITRAGTFSQGAGCLGQGMLFDGSGDDYRRVDMFAQGFGGPGGEGVLVDYSGSDCLLAGFRYSHEPLLPDDNQSMSQGFAMGLRPLIAGGIGLLADYGSGNDTYRVEVFGQGTAYFYGLGLMYDEEGQDTYNAAQYSQGSGIHLASGCLWDGDGDDCYFSRNGPAQGSAHDLSTGFLVDGGGNDWYSSDGGQALSLTNSAAVFIDFSGNDTYTARGGGQGEARWARGSSGIGVFLDLADEDVYSGTGADSVLWTNREYGSGIDLAVSTPGGLVPQDPVGDPGSLSLDSLFSVASEWGVGPNGDRVTAHREELAARGEEAVAFLVQHHLGTLSGLESRAMEKVFNGNTDASMEQLLPLLARLDSLALRNGGNLVYFLGKMGDDRARIPLEDVLCREADSLSARLRPGIVRALGDIGSCQSVEAVSGFASDSSGRVRREVAVTLGKICTEDAVEVLEILALDPGLDIRSAAEHALMLIIESVDEDESDPDD